VLNPDLESSSSVALLEAGSVEGGADVSGDTSQEKKASAEGTEGSGNSGRLLLLLLKGTRSSTGGAEGATGALPDNLNDERWHKDRWEPLLAPFADSENPKRFVTAETFLPGNGVSVSGSGAQPCIIRDIPEIDLMFMYKPSGWATCSTPQWQGVEGNLIRYVWT
ncbi:unnamed protein product, partial [Polarella glacialis]